MIRFKDEINNVIASSKNCVINIPNGLHDLQQHTFLKIHFQNPLSPFGQGRFMRWFHRSSFGHGWRSGCSWNPGNRLSLTVKARLTDVWIHVELSEPMQSLDKKFNQFHQERITANMLKQFGFRKVSPIMLRKPDSVRVEQNVLDLRPVIRKIGSGPWIFGSKLLGSYIFKYCSRIFHCIFLFSSIRK